MQIPADGIIITADKLTTNESSITGELEPIKKKTIEECIKKKEEKLSKGTIKPLPTPVVLSGTQVITVKVGI